MAPVTLTIPSLVLPWVVPVADSDPVVMRTVALPVLRMEAMLSTMLMPSGM